MMPPSHIKNRYIACKIIQRGTFSQVQASMCAPGEQSRMWLHLSRGEYLKPHPGRRPWNDPCRRRGVRAGAGRLWNAKWKLLVVHIHHLAMKIIVQVFPVWTGSSSDVSSTSAGSMFQIYSIPTWGRDWRVRLCQDRCWMQRMEAFREISSAFQSDLGFSSLRKTFVCDLGVGSLLSTRRPSPGSR